jgi:hypothetical protein
MLKALKKEYDFKNFIKAYKYTRISVKISAITIISFAIYN